MAVLLSDRMLSVRRAGEPTVDGHGEKVPGPFGEEEGPWPGSAEEQPDAEGPADTINSRTWKLGVDPQAWPLFVDDLVVDSRTGEQWLVTSAERITSPVAPVLNWIRVLAHAHTSEGTRP